MPAASSADHSGSDASLLDNLIALAAIPSVSTEPAHAADVRRAADWVAGRLAAIGVPTVELVDTARHPVVLGWWRVGPNRPTVLVYGHYDVQPADPLPLWNTAPFEPTVVGDRVYARGASDMKANLVAVLAAIESLAREAGTPPVNLVFLFEGEEEIGSPNLEPLLRARADDLRCDVVLNTDGGMLSPTQPSLLVSSKGLSGCQVDLRTAAGDLHSGMHGAAVPNAAQAIATLVASLHDADGRVAVAGFYDKVRDLSPEERAELPSDAAHEAAYAAGLGVTALWGEPGWNAEERRGARPTVDVNGIWSGFTGDGSKTVTPSEGHAKLTCRLVPDQDPREIHELLKRHLLSHAPTGATVTVGYGHGAAPYGIRRDHPVLAVVRDVLRDLYGGTEPTVERTGGTVPVLATFQQVLGVDSATLGWGLPDANIHAPNEWFRVEDLDRAKRGYVAFLSRLGEPGALG